MKEKPSLACGLWANQRLKVGEDDQSLAELVFDLVFGLVRSSSPFSRAEIPKQISGYQDLTALQFCDQSEQVFSGARTRQKQGHPGRHA